MSGHSRRPISESERDVSRRAMRLARLLRERQGWTQEQFAEKLTANGARIGRTSLGAMETGHSTLTLAQAVIMAATLEVSLDVLAAGVQCDRCQGFPPAGFSCNDCGASTPAAEAGQDD